MNFVTLSFFLLIGQTFSKPEDKDTNNLSPTMASPLKNTSPTVSPNQTSNLTDASLLPSESSSTLLTTSFTPLASLSPHSDTMMITVQSTTLLPSTNIVLTSGLFSTDSLQDMTSMATLASLTIVTYTPPAAPTTPAVSTPQMVPTAPTAIIPPTESYAGINPSSPSAFTPIASVSSTTTTPTRSEQSTSSTKTTSAPSTTKVTPATSTVPPKPIKISETNILLYLNQDAFVEVQGPNNAQAQNLSLAVQDASLPYRLSDAIVVTLVGTFNQDGYLLVNNLTNVLKPSPLNWTSVLIVLLDSSNNLNLDHLVYSTTAEGKVDSGISERFSIKYNLIADSKNFPNVGISFSRCLWSGSSGEFFLTKQSKNEKNLCSLTNVQDLELKMTRDLREAACPKNLPSDFNNTLARTIISGVNGKNSCGFSWGMITKFQEKFDCPIDKVVEVTVSFTVTAALQEQMKYVVDGYKRLLSDKNLQLKDSNWTMADCTQNCSPSIKPPKNDEDDKIRVTVAVVVSCIGVFLIVLIAVVIYMKSKRNRILQFRMTRLDDDEDELIGDLDDFLGNQAPTFHR